MIMTIGMKMVVCGKDVGEYDDNDDNNDINNDKDNNHINNDNINNDNINNDEEIQINRM